MSPFRWPHTSAQGRAPQQSSPGQRRLPAGPTHSQDPGDLTCSQPNTLLSHQPPVPAPPPLSALFLTQASPPPQELQPGSSHGAPLGLGPHLRDGANPGRRLPCAARRTATPRTPARAGSRAAIQAPRQVPGEGRDLPQSANERAGRSRPLPDVRPRRRSPEWAGPGRKPGPPTGLSELCWALATSSFWRKALP